MNREKKRRLERDLYYKLGWSNAIIALMHLGVILLIFNGMVEIVGIYIILCLVLAMTNPMGGKAMKTAIKRMLGIHHVEGKLTAMAKYLKVRFNLVPEHWECEPVKD